jgi:hypothetical protein
MCSPNNLLTAKVAIIEELQMRVVERSWSFPNQLQLISCVTGCKRQVPLYWRDRSNQQPL